MSSTREVVVLSGARTAIGGFGGSLKDFPPSDLAALCVREAVKRAGVESGEVRPGAAGGDPGVNDLALGTRVSPRPAQHAGLASSDCHVHGSNLLRGNARAARHGGGALSCFGHRVLYDY